MMSAQSVFMSPQALINITIKKLYTHDSFKEFVGSAVGILTFNIDCIFCLTIIYLVI